MKELIKNLRPLRDCWPADGIRPAAVLLLIQKDGSGHHVLFIRRARTMNSHRGQIAFPGGRADAADAGPVGTALRETREELGIPAGSIRVVGSLRPQTAIDRSLVLPFVGFTTATGADIRANPAEVEEVLPVPLHQLTRTDSQPFGFTRFGKRRHSHFFRNGGNIIWGLTAEILYDADLQPPGPG